MERMSLRASLSKADTLNLQYRSPLIEHMKICGRPHKETEALLESAQLPTPDANEYKYSIDGGYIFFLPDHGIMFRLIDRKRFPQAISDHILQPYFSYSLNEHTNIEIYPEIPNPVSTIDIQKLKQALAFQGIKFWDSNNNFNAGYLPVKSKKFPDGIPVIIDHGAYNVSHAYYIISPLKQLFNEDGQRAPIQHKLFGNIKHLFTDAFDQENGIFREKPFQIALNESREIQKRLFEGKDWIIDHVEHQRVHLIRNNYSAHVNRTPS